MTCPFLTGRMCSIEKIRVDPFDICKDEKYTECPIYRTTVRAKSMISTIRKSAKK